MSIYILPVFMWRLILSTLSDIFHAFKNALNLSRERYTTLYTSQADVNGKLFYEQFLHKCNCYTKVTYLKVDCGRQEKCDPLAGKK